MVENKSRITVDEIQEEFAKSDHIVSTKTIRTSLHKLGLLTDDQMQNRLNWCTERREWSTKEWNEIVWSDESRFCLFNDGHSEYGEKKAKDLMWKNLYRQ